MGDKLVSDATPRGMLKLYRQLSTTWDNEQAKQFLAMPAAERMELLFYMTLHQTKVIQNVHSLISPQEAEVMPMPEAEKPN